MTNELWEEKSNTLQLTKNEKLIEEMQEITIKNTEKKLEKKECGGIGFLLGRQKFKKTMNRNIFIKYQKYIGERFNKLVVKSIIIDSITKKNHFECECDCGKQTMVKNLVCLISGGVKSCGCLRIINRTKYHTLEEKKQAEREAGDRHNARERQKQLEKQRESIGVIYGEIWKDVLGYEGNYSVSNFGRIRSNYKYIKDKNSEYKKIGICRLLKLSIDRFGYNSTHLFFKGERLHTFLHRVMAIAFIPNPLNLPEVNHINAIKGDDRLENLEWCTHQENMDHASKMGLVKPNGLKGEKAAMSN